MASRTQGSSSGKTDSGEQWLDGDGLIVGARAGTSESSNTVYASNDGYTASSSSMERNGSSASSRNGQNKRGHQQQQRQRLESPTSSPSLSSQRGAITPPPRRLGSSIPLPQAQSPPLDRVYHDPSTFPSPSIRQFTRHAPQNRIQRLKQVVYYSYEGLNELIHLIHPDKLNFYNGLTDQASWSLICYKLYVLSITIPANSKLYFYYLPSCLLSDLLAVLLLQLSGWFLFSDYWSENGTRIGYDSITTPTMRSTSSSNSESANKSIWRNRLKGFGIGLLKKTPFGKSYHYTALPFDTSNTATAISTISTSPETPTNMMRHSASHPNANNSAGLGISSRENEQGRSLLFDWQNEDLQNPTRRFGNNDDMSASSFPVTRGNEEDFKNEDIQNEDIILRSSEEEEEGEISTNGRKVEYGENILRVALGTEKWNLSTILKFVMLVIMKTFHIIACLVAVVFTVIAIGAYSAGRVVFSWQGAFDSTSQSGYLLSMALGEIPHFLAAYAVVFGLGTATTLSRCWIPRLIDNGTLSTAKASRYIPSGKKIRIALISIIVISFLSICAMVRPPKALPATDLLIDGVTATSAILLFKDDHTQPIALNKNTTIYGQSNAYQPRLTPINSDQIKHVFFIFLESADYLAWPYQPDKFCKHRNCEDMDPKYNKVEEFTPFFNDLIKNDKNTVYIKDFRTNLAYTIKAHLTSLCGVMAHIKDYISSEAELDSPTSCLPHLLKALSDKNDDDDNTNAKSKAGRKVDKKNWKSGWFQAQMTAYDRQHEVIRREGFQEIWDSNTLTAKFGQKKEWTNYFGYADEELYPFVWDWIDDRLKNDENIFMATAGATMHHPFTVPPWVEKTEYTKTEWTNNYLNVVKRTDRDLKLFFDNLKKRNLLDKSLIIMQGDHGPRISEDGIYRDYGWWEHIYRAPLVIRAPGLIPQHIEQDPTRPYIALDILPTILDALGVKPSIMKSFVGQSIFRARARRHLRDSYHAQSRGGQYPHHLRTLKHNTYKALRMDTGDTCATDVKVDSSETFFYCEQEGWRKVFEGDELKDGITKGLWKKDSKEEQKLIDYTHEASKLLDIHLEVNKDFWDIGKHKEENIQLREKFLETVHEQAHWH